MSKHFLVVVPDAAYNARFTDPEDFEVIWSIECAEPEKCHGWTSCDEDHDGFDVDDEGSPAYDMTDGDEVEIHGTLHECRSVWGWCIRFKGCVVDANAREMDCIEGLYPLKEGRFEVEADWNYDLMTLNYVKENKEKNGD